MEGLAAVEDPNQRQDQGTDISEGADQKQPVFNVSH